MTRINCVPVEELTTPHLIAEYRELPRVFALSHAALERGDNPAHHGTEYVMGTGHVKFFYSRLGYAKRRMEDLVAEMLARGFNPAHRNSPDISPWPKSWRRDWTPTPAALEVNRYRIMERNRK